MRTLVLSALLTGVTLATSGTAQSQDTLTERDGLRLMRWMMSVQANRPFGTKGGFGTLDEVVRHAVAEIPDPMVTKISRSGEVLNYVFRIAPSPDRKSYEISLTPASGCGQAWFGNEKLLIYTGKALGCS